MVKGKSHSASWLVNAAQQCVIDKDIFAAKAWLLTAKTLFPADFSIQYEEFLMEREAGNVQVCGKLFYDMLTTFSKEPVLWEELSRIFYSQDVTKTQPENKFLKEMFDSLSVMHQRELLLKYANHQEDLIDKCRISLLVLKRFKGAIKDQAEKLISTLKNFEDKECADSPLNTYRKMIVCEVLPLIIKSPNTQVLQSKSIKYQADSLLVSEDQMINYLNMTMEFFVAYAIRKSSLLPCATDATLKEDFDIDESISSWSLLHESFVCFAVKLGWSNVLKFKDKIDPSKNRPLKSRWKTLSKARETRNPLGLFYAVLQLHIFAMLEYCSIILKSNEKSLSPSAVESILVDNIDHMTRKEATEKTGIRTPKKKKKSEDSASYSDHYSSSEDVTIVIHPDLMGHINESIGEYLQVAIDTQNFLKAVFNAEYEQIFLDWKMNSWRWTDTFEIDALLFQGKHAKVIEALKHQLSLKKTLQLSSALFSSGYHKMACETVLQTVDQLNLSAFEDVHLDDKAYSNPEGRSLLLLSSSPNDILTYAVQIISASLKARLYGDDEHRDMVIGHLIVLSQLMWSKNEDSFLYLLRLIQTNEKGFKYPLFFTYVTQIDILEEFAYLYSLETVPLELSFPEENMKHTITRGVNKGAHNDFKTAIMRQVSRSNEPIKNLVFRFLRNEKEAILRVM